MNTKIDFSPYMNTEITNIGLNCTELCLEHNEYVQMGNKTNSFNSKYEAVQANDKKSISPITCKTNSVVSELQTLFSVVCNATATYPGIVGVNNSFYVGTWEEHLACTLENLSVPKTTGSAPQPKSSCVWTAKVCFEENETQTCEPKGKVKFNFSNFSDSQEIPQDTTGIPLFSTQTSYLKIGVGAASTAFCIYKVYNETRKLLEESRRKPGDKFFRLERGRNQPVEKASGLRALGYTALAVGSGIYTLAQIRYLKA